MTLTTTKLQEFCRIVQGGRHGLSGNDFVADGFPAYGAGGINGHLASYEFDEPAVVLSAIGARCGKCFYATGKWSSLANTQVILPDPSRADARFMWYQLNDERRWHRSGTGQPFIKPLDVKVHRVHLPPLAEQRRTAALLDQADTLRAKRRAALAQLDTLTQSIFLDLFGDPVPNPRGWRVARLGDCTTTASGGTPDRKNNEYFGGSIPWVKSGELDNDPVVATEETLTHQGLANSSAKLMPAGTVLMAMYGATVGAISRLGISAATNQAICCITPGPTVESEYLIACLRWFTPTLLERRVGGAQPNLSQDLLRNLPLPCPPVLLQEQFSMHVTALKVIRRTHLASLTLLDTLFASLQHLAFRGGI